MHPVTALQSLDTRVRLLEARTKRERQFKMQARRLLHDIRLYLAKETAKIPVPQSDPPG